MNVTVHTHVYCVFTIYIVDTLYTKTAFLVILVHYGCLPCFSVPPLLLSVRQTFLPATTSLEHVLEGNMNWSQQDNGHNQNSQ